MKGGQRILDVRHLSYSFGSHWALKNVSFKLDKGDFLFLFGPSGAGKTTLLRMLYGSLPVTRGAASIAGFDLKRLKKRRIPLLRRNVSVVFQDFKILPDHTVFENVAIALEVRLKPERHIARRVRAVLRSLGLENMLHRKCRELSGGEQQRVAIARSIVVNPKIILADEPTGNLDKDLAFHLMEIFHHFHEIGTTIIMATHNRELVSAQPDPRILVLEDGLVKGYNWPGGEQPQGRVVSPIKTP